MKLPYKKSFFYLFIGVILSVSFVAGKLDIFGNDSGEVIQLGEEEETTTSSNATSSNVSLTNVAFVNNSNTFVDGTTQSVSNLTLRGEMNGIPFQVCFDRPSTIADAYFNFESFVCSGDACFFTPFAGSLTWISFTHEGTNFVTGGAFQTGARINGANGQLVTTSSITGARTISDFDRQARGIDNFTVGSNLSLFTNMINGTFRVIGGGCLGGYYN